jgi:hypothetical protein
MTEYPMKFYVDLGNNLNMYMYDSSSNRAYVKAHMLFKDRYIKVISCIPI